MKYLQIPDLPGLWWSKLNTSRWILFELYLTDARVMMVRPVKCESSEGIDDGSPFPWVLDPTKSDPLDHYCDEGWNSWYGPVERPPDPALSDSERKVFEEYKAVMNWLERNGAPDSIVYDSDSECGAWFINPELLPSSKREPIRLRDAVLAEIRKEQQ